MSVIWGLWRRDRNPSAALDLSRMAGRLTGFGPDGSGEWTRAGLGLGRMLAMTLPEDDFDRQPMHLADGSVMVADVRLDNRTELATLLSIDAVRQSTMADSQLLAAAWERWRSQCLTRLAGAFAFVVWDEPKQRLFCARDQLGRRPLYYYSDGPLFAFASLPRGLRGIREVPWTIDEEMIAIWLALLPRTGERTYFQKIRKLAPAHALSVTEAGQTATAYWTPDLERCIDLPREEEYCEAFRELFDQAVRCRLRARAPIGSLLSGGFDSGSVSAAAAMLLAAEGRQLTAFTAVPSREFDGRSDPDRFSNEAQHAASVAARYPNIRHVLVPPSPLCPLDLMARPRAWGDTPGSHFSMLPHAYAMGIAHREAGVGVVLIGLNGNMTISYKGLCLPSQLLRQLRWRQWYQEAQGLRARAHFGWPGVLALSLGPSLPAWLWRALHARNKTLFHDVRQYALLHPRYFRYGTIFRLAAELGWDLSYLPFSDGRQERLAGLSRFDYGPAAATGFALCGVDFRDPTSDRRLLEFCLAVPENLWLRQGRTKYLLRQAMQGRLSQLVLEEWRRGLSGADSYLRVAPFRARFSAAIEEISESPVARQCLDLARMRELVARWPDDWSTLLARREYGMGLNRAIQAGAFIRWVERSA